MVSAVEKKKIEQVREITSGRVAGLSCKLKLAHSCLNLVGNMTDKAVD